MELLILSMCMYKISGWFFYFKREAKSRPTYKNDVIEENIKDDTNKDAENQAVHKCSSLNTIMFISEQQNTDYVNL